MGLGFGWNPHPQRPGRSFCPESWSPTRSFRSGFLFFLRNCSEKPLLNMCHRICNMQIIVELRTPATPVGVGGGKERGGCHLNLRTWHAEGRRPILGLCWPILRLCWPMPMRTKCCNLQHFALWDGKNPCKYNSFSPRKWLKHSYLQSFVHITIFDFLKNV